MHKLEAMRNRSCQKKDKVHCQHFFELGPSR